MGVLQLLETDTLSTCGFFLQYVSFKKTPCFTFGRKHGKVTFCSPASVHPTIPYIIFWVSGPPLREFFHFHSITFVKTGVLQNSLLVFRLCISTHVRIGAVRGQNQLRSTQLQAPSEAREGCRAQDFVRPTSAELTINLSIKIGTNIE